MSLSFVTEGTDEQIPKFNIPHYMFPFSLPDPRNPDTLGPGNTLNDKIGQLRHNFLTSGPIATSGAMNIATLQLALSVGACAWSGSVGQ